MTQSQKVYARHLFEQEGHSLVSVAQMFSVTLEELKVYLRST